MAKESKEPVRKGVRRGGSYVVDLEGNVLSIDGKPVGGSQPAKNKPAGKDGKPKGGSDS